MRLSYTNIKDQYLRNIGKAGSTDENLINDFKLHLSQRYQMIMGSFTNYQTQVPYTLSTVAGQQYYSTPVSISSMEDVVVTINGVNYVLSVISSQKQWDFLNAIQIQPTTFPWYFFPRRDDFGIFPIPQDVYTITLNRHFRDRNLEIEDYLTGTISATNASTTITGSGTTFASYMVGMWLTVTDTTKAGWGYWYRIGGVTDATHLELEKSWQSLASSGATYRICQTPEIPEEGHIMLVDGVTADYYAGLRDDPNNATWWNNKFWTGDGNNNNRGVGNSAIQGGLIGMMNRYADRNKEVLVNRRPHSYTIGDKAWIYTISE